MIIQILAPTSTRCINQHQTVPHCNYDQLNFDVLNFLQTAAAHIINKANSQKF